MICYATSQPRGLSIEITGVERIASPQLLGIRTLGTMALRRKPQINKVMY